MFCNALQDCVMQRIMTSNCISIFYFPNTMFESIIYNRLAHYCETQRQTYCMCFWMACFSSFTQLLRILEVIADRVNTALFVWGRWRR